MWTKLHTVICNTESATWHHAMVHHLSCFTMAGPKLDTQSFASFRETSEIQTKKLLTALEDPKAQQVTLGGICTRPSLPGKKKNMNGEKQRKEIGRILRTEKLPPHTWRVKYGEQRNWIYSPQSLTPLKPTSFNSPKNRSSSMKITTIYYLLDWFSCTNG